MEAKRLNAKHDPGLCPDSKRKAARKDILEATGKEL